MNVDVLWKNYKFPNCENCKKDCGKYKYDNLCSNLNYLKNYGQEYFDRMKESFEELNKLNNNKMTIFTFGYGCNLDYFAGTEVFNNLSYIGVDNTEWAIKETKTYKNLSNNEIKNNFNYNEGIKLLSIVPNNVVVCFFNSLNDILQNTNELKSDLVESLERKSNFYIICNYTRGGNHTLAWNEECFLKSLCNKLRENFSIKRLEILRGEGIIISGNRK